MYNSNRDVIGAFEDGMERHEGSGPVHGSCRCHEDQECVDRGR
jgi:hypothetical protein